MDIDRCPNDAPGYLSFEFLPGGQKSGVRSPVSDGHSKSLRAPHYCIRPKFTRRGEQTQSQNISGHRYQAPGFVDFFNEVAVVVDGPIRSGKLQKGTKDRLFEVNVTVDQEDYGRLIGRNGQTINAIRTVAEAAGKRQGVSVAVEVVDGPRPPRSSD